MKSSDSSSDAGNTAESHGIVSVAIPTFKRPEALISAVRSVFAQEQVNAFTIIIVDNDPAESSRDALELLASEAPPHIAFKFGMEPSPGVANARNRLMDLVSTPLIAFLDDDQTAAPMWLSALLRSYDSFPAAATFGPVTTALPATVKHHREYLNGFFLRAPAQLSGYTEESYGCGNCLLDRERLPDLDPLFDVEMNASGGEDDHLFRSIRQAGETFAWAGEAMVFEHVPEDRANLSYALRRAAAYGSSPVLEALTEARPRYDKMLFWMCIGAGQFAVYGSSYLLQFIARHPRRAFAQDKAARAWGKMYWWKKREFYGTAI